LFTFFFTTFGTFLIRKLRRLKATLAIVFLRGGFRSGFRSGFLRRGFRGGFRRGIIRLSCA
jgi:hypothetical protein